MKTVQEIIAYLEAKLDETIGICKYMEARQHEDYGKYLQRLYVLEEILQDIDT